MKSKLSLLLFCGLACLVSPVVAQNFFWSLDGFGEGAVNGDLLVNTNVNPAGSVYLYYNDNGQDVTEGFDLDFSWDVNGVVGFTAAEAFEADVTFTQGGPAIGNRWGDAFGPAAEVTSDNVDAFLGVNV